MENNQKRIPWNKNLKTNKPAHNRINIDKDELTDLYLNKQLTSQELANYYSCSSKTIRNWLIRYNVPIRPIRAAVKLERSKWSDEKELQRSRNYHNTWCKKSKEEIKIITKKRALSPNINSNNAIKKAYKTRTTNKTNTESKAENNFYHHLLVLGFKETDIVRHYSDNRYPFDCDFYIKSLDLFIEYQGHWTHGIDIFNKDNKEHLDYLSKMQMKNINMDTWIKRDPIKLDTALKNKINLMLIYPKYKTYLIQNNNITTIDINDINKI